MMNRRDFMQIASAGTLGGTVAAASAREGETPAASLPTSQSRPLPEVGSLWSEVFAGLSARCQPRMSFLNDAFTDPAAWSAQARAVLLDRFHYSPPCVDPRPEIVDRVDCGTHHRERVLIDTAAGIRIPVYVLVPKGLARPAPGIVALHDHGGFYFWGKEKLVRVEPEHPELTAFKDKYYGGRSIADELAGRGFVVIVADMLHWGERGMVLAADPDRVKRRTPAVTAQDIRQFNARSWAHEELIGRMALACGATWSGIVSWDDRRVTDYLLARPEVDPARVGCVGLSVGAVRSIFLGATHAAVRASVAVCWMAEYQPMVKGHLRYCIGFTKLVPGLYGDLDWPDLGGLHWPGALLTMNGSKDTLYPLEAGKAAFEKLRQIFTKAGSPEKHTGVYFDGPHEFNVAMQQRAFDWLTHQLAT